MSSLRAAISHGSNGFILEVYTEPIWSVLFDRFYDGALTAAGSPCCHDLHGHSDRRSWAGFIYDHLPESEVEGSLRDRFATAQFRLLSNRFTSVNRRKTAALVDITIEQARQVCPEFVDEMSEIFPAHEQAPSMEFWSTNSPIQMTVSTGTSGQIEFFRG